MEKYKTIALFALLVIFGYLTFKILVPFATYIILGLILAFLVYPIYAWLGKRVQHIWAALIVLIAVLLIIIIPSFWLTIRLVNQAGDAYQALTDGGMSTLFDKLQSWTNFDVTPYFNSAVDAGKNFLAGALPSLITTTGSVMLGLIIIFLVMYYALRSGPFWYASASNLVPIQKKYKRKLQEKIESITKALFYGQILTSVLIGLLCGLVFFLFGVSNPVFWGFVMMIFSFLPIVGAPFVYVPAGIILIMNDHWIAGISVLVLCTIAMMGVDYVVRPKVVRSQAHIHPLITILGALGGISMFGFVGFLIGPLVLSIFLTLLEFDYRLD